MAKDLATVIAGLTDLKSLSKLEGRIKKHNAGTPEIALALAAKYEEFGRQLVAEKTGIDLSELTSAEDKIVNATGRYVALQKRDGKGAARTFQILANRSLIEAAEVTVAKSKVTQGYEVLEAADLKSLSFEQIIVDHPEEFSARALWFANRTLGLPNDSEKAPADSGTLTQQRTERVLDWLSDRAAKNGGELDGYTNAEVGGVLGFDDLARHGRVLGNIQSRLDFACYQADMPPLGLCVVEHFANAWSREERKWAFPVANMREAARAFIWTPQVFDAIRVNARLLPGQAAISWRKELREKEMDVRRWAEGLVAAQDRAMKPGPNPTEADLAGLERKLLGRPPAVRERVSKSIERGSIGTRLKRINGFRCQICEAMGLEPLGFIKPDGNPYVEAHHATPVSAMEVGSLSATNIMILCANHHRQMHYGLVQLNRTDKQFLIKLDGVDIKINRFSLRTP